MQFISRKRKLKDVEELKNSKEIFTKSLTQE